MHEGAESRLVLDGANGWEWGKIEELAVAWPGKKEVQLLEDGFSAFWIVCHRVDQQFTGKKNAALLRPGQRITRRPVERLTWGSHVTPPGAEDRRR